VEVEAVKMVIVDVARDVVPMVQLAEIDTEKLMTNVCLLSSVRKVVG
jgi:hypothetical protein